MDVEQRISQIDDRLEEIDVEIHRLSSLKQKLKKERDNLIDKKNFEKSTELSENDWSNGEFYLTFILRH
jgi:hypothetical protein